MSPIRSILVHLDATPRSAERLDAARQLALPHEAAVRGLYAATSSFVEMPFAVAENSSAGQIALGLDAERRDRARAVFDRAMQSHAGPPVVWSELGPEPVIWGFTSQALYADLVVLGQHEADSAKEHDVPPDFVESVLIGSGKPALIVPYAGALSSVGNNVLVAWNATRESARAVSLALPLLQRAQQVHLVAWGDRQNAPLGANERTQIEQYLASQGLA